jgi:hypothetical protein
MVTGQLSILSVSLLTKQTNRWPHGQRPKKSYFSSACEYVKFPFSLRVPKKITYYKRGRIYLFFNKMMRLPARHSGAILSLCLVHSVIFVV